MDEIMFKFYSYLLQNNVPSSKEFYELKEISKQNDLDFLETYTLASKKVEEVKEIAERIGYGVDFDSFCSILEKYLMEKKNFTNNDKKEYLTVLALLSAVYDVDIREEFERSTNKISESKEIDVVSCIIEYIKPNYSIEELEKIKNEKEKNVDKVAITYVIDLKRKASELNTDIDEISFAETMQEYKEIKKKLSDEEKKKYLNFLVHLSRIYDVNLKDKVVDTYKEHIFKEMDYEQVEKIFYDRFDTGTFNDLKENERSIAEVAYYRTLSKLIVGKTDNESDKQVIQDFIDLNNFKWQGDRNPEDALYNSISFNNIKDRINCYIPKIIEFLRKCMKDDKKKVSLVKEYQKSLILIENKVIS